MSPLLIVAIVVAAVVLTIRTARHSLADRDAVEAHHRTLDTLGEIAEHTTGATGYGGPTATRPHVRLVRPGRDQPNVYGPTEIPVIPPPVLSETGDPLAGRYEDRADVIPPEPAGMLVATTITPAGPDPMTHPDPAPARAGRPPASGHGNRRASGSDQRRAVRSPARHRRSRQAPPAAVVLIGFAVVGLVGVFVALALNSGHSSRSPRAAGRRVTAQTAPPTSQPAQPVVLVSSDSREARYRVAGTSAEIQVVSASACWVQIRAGTSTGPVIFAGTLRSGDRRTLPATAASWVRLGNPPAISIQVNGVSLAALPASPSQPYNVLFEPA